MVPAAGHAVSAVALRQRRRGRARSEVGQVEGDRLAFSLQGLLGFSFMSQIIFTNCFSGFGTEMQLIFGVDQFTECGISSVSSGDSSSSRQMLQLL